MEKLFKFLFFFLMFCAPQAFAQSIVTGEVVDEKSEPLIGATVMVKGTSTGTSTDIDGKFSLAAKTGDVLEVSYVGYESKAVKVPESGKLRITLTEISTGLDVKRRCRSILENLDRFNIIYVNRVERAVIITHNQTVNHIYRA